MILLSVSIAFGNFFDTVVNYAEAFWDYIVNAVNALISLIEVVAAMGGIVTVFQPMLWSPIWLSMSLVLSVGLIRMLLSMGNE